MDPKLLGNTGLSVTPIGFGAFKIGRNEGIKYTQGYELPSMDAVRTLLHSVLDLGINYIDTAPAYGLSEERIGDVLGSNARNHGVVISTKVGERFESGVSKYDYSARGVRASIERSLRRLKTDRLDIVLIHSHGRDLEIMNQTDAVETLLELRGKGLIDCVGLSGKTVEGSEMALQWADVIMVEHHLQDRSHTDVIALAKQRGVGVVVKKGLASGQLEPERAIRFVMETPGVNSLVIGGLDPKHIRNNVLVAESLMTHGPVEGV